MSIFDDFQRKVQRAGKHVSRAISKPFSGANIPNLQQLERVMIEADQRGGIGRVADQTIRSGSFDFTWLQALSPHEFSQFRGQWIAVLQRESAVKKDRYHYAASAADPGTRMRLMQDTGNTEMWESLQDVKNTYRAMAKAREESVFENLKKSVTDTLARLQDRVHHNPVFGMYLTYFDQAQRTFDHATLHGSENQLQDRILAAGGLNKIASGTYNAVTGTVRAVATLGTDVSAVKKAVTGAVDAVNHLGGMVKGVSDLARGREADLRSLSARYGIDKGIHDKLDAAKRTVLGTDHRGTIRDQVARLGPQALSREAGIYEEDLAALRKELAHSLYWVAVWEKDVEAMREELARLGEEEREHRQAALRQAANDPSFRSAQADVLLTTLAQARQQYGRHSEETAKHLKRFKDMMVGELRAVDELLASANTRRAVADQQIASVNAGFQYSIKRTLAMEAAAFDRKRLRHVQAGDAPSRKALGADRATLDRIEALVESEMRATARAHDRIWQELSADNPMPSEPGIPDLGQALLRAELGDL
ncbi:MAG: hypothetical protein RH859_05025 [Longimicrobiales bacterium]